MRSISSVFNHIYLNSDNTHKDALRLTDVNMANLEATQADFSEGSDEDYSEEEEFEPEVIEPEPEVDYRLNLQDVYHSPLYSFSLTTKGIIKKTYIDKAPIVNPQGINEASILQYLNLYERELFPRYMSSDLNVEGGFQVINYFQAGGRSILEMTLNLNINATCQLLTDYIDRMMDCLIRVHELGIVHGMPDMNSFWIDGDRVTLTNFDISRYRGTINSASALYEYINPGSYSDEPTSGKRDAWTLGVSLLNMIISKIPEKQNPPDPLPLTRNNLNQLEDHLGINMNTPITHQDFNTYKNQLENTSWVITTVRYIPKAYGALTQKIRDLLSLNPDQRMPSVPILQGLNIYNPHRSCHSNATLTEAFKIYLKLLLKTNDYQDIISPILVIVGWDVIRRSSGLRWSSDQIGLLSSIIYLITVQEYNSDVHEIILLIRNNQTINYDNLKNITRVILDQIGWKITTYENSRITNNTINITELINKLLVNLENTQLLINNDPSRPNPANIMNMSAEQLSNFLAS